MSLLAAVVTPKLGDESVTLLTIRDAQLAAVGRSILYRTCTEAFPKVRRELGKLGFRARVDVLVEQAKAVGLSEELEVTRFVHLGLDLGPEFPGEPGWIAEILSWNQPPRVCLEAVEDRLRREQARAAGFQA